MKRLLLTLPFAFVLAGCHTTQVSTAPDGTARTNRVYDVAKTEAVKAIAQGTVTFAFTEALAQFTNDANQIALYARAAGGVFCEMKATAEFSPETLEAALFNLALPRIENDDTRRYLQHARNLILSGYKVAYAKRFTAELSPEQWPYVVAEIFCNSINESLINSGRPGIGGVTPGVLPSTVNDERAREAVRQALDAEPARKPDILKQ